MAKSQTRRTISVSKSLYTAAKEYARTKAKKPLSQLTEEGLRVVMGLPPSSPASDPAAAG